MFSHSHSLARFSFVFPLKPTLAHVLAFFRLHARVHSRQCTRSLVPPFPSHSLIRLYVLSFISTIFFRFNRLLAHAHKLELVLARVCLFAHILSLSFDFWNVRSIDLSLRIPPFLLPSHFSPSKRSVHPLVGLPTRVFACAYPFTCACLPSCQFTRAHL